MEHLHPGAKWIFRIRAYSILLFLGIFLSFWSFASLFVALFSGKIIMGYVFVYIFAIIVFLVIIGEIYARMAYNRWKYELTNHELKLEKGIIFKVYKSIPYERVQNVEIYRGILARMIGFSTLNIQTAGYHYSGGRGTGAMAEGHIPAVSVQGAEKIREFLMKKIGRRQGL